MRYSKAAASSLLSSVLFAFQAKSVVVVADIFDPPDVVDVGALALKKEEDKHSFATKFKDNDEDEVIRKDGGLNHARKRPAPPVTGTAADTGILAATAAGATAPSMTALAANPSECAAGDIVECDDGYLADGVTSCFTACDGACCVYEIGGGVKYDACIGFTGKVCKDQVSCVGYDACRYATIPSGVVKSCKGLRACYAVGYSFGKIGKIVDSCIGYEACISTARFYGSVGDITGSCYGDYACFRLGRTSARVGNVFKSCLGDHACENLGWKYGTVGDLSNACTASKACYQGAKYGGAIGSITGSCTDEYSCYFLGHTGKVGDLTNACSAYKACYEGAQYGGTIGSITGSCTDKYSCYYLAKHGGKVGTLSNACTAYKACYEGAEYGGTIGSITGSCTDKYSCYSLGYGGGKVGNVKDSCKADYACSQSGMRFGSIGSISASCNAEYACLRTGATLNRAITSNLNNCCNAVNACENATQATLPAQCKDSKVRILFY
jgi:hypothetical protein